MRIKSVTLRWFRGAADEAVLNTDLKSVLVYGENGSGKSSFVDAIEYVLDEGKVRHLAHEYSGKHQEKGLINTAMPAGIDAGIEIILADARDCSVRIKANGAAKRSGLGVPAMEAWDYHRTVLRQDEVAAFIRDTKGAKYSAILPLLGLGSLELAAENLRQLTKAIEQNVPLRQARDHVARVHVTRGTLFGDQDDNAIYSTLNLLHDQYCAEESKGEVPGIVCLRVKRAVAAKVASASSEQRRHVAVRTIAQVTLTEYVAGVRAASVQLAASAEPFVAERLELLGAAKTFAKRVALTGEILCPACGQPVEAQAFSAHVEGERARLSDIAEAFERRKAYVANLCQALATIKSEAFKPELGAWRTLLESSGHKGALDYLSELDVEALRANCDDAAIRQIELLTIPFIAAAAVASESAPADLQELSRAGAVAEFCQEFLRALGSADLVAHSGSLLAFVRALEAGVRQEIRARSKTAIDDISGDIRSMWEVLHPSSAIQDVALYYPEDVDKAIDVQLTFYGVSQASPRLTLSEGYRNSLGLCIFLAMAKRDAHSDRPLILDDVVVSLDRNHRGMIRELLEKEFASRQVILLTHDRDWYTELRQQLDDGAWLFKTLWPYAEPASGIRWSSRSATFDDARALIDTLPDAAGNTARKIMDIELALLAEKLELRLPYRHGYRNDHRTGYDFLTRLIADAPACLKKSHAAKHASNDEAVAVLKTAESLLVSWGNRASHTFDIAREEARKLIEACELALAQFSCSNCKKMVHRLDDSSGEFKQCQCGAMRWRYGKSQ